MCFLASVCFVSAVVVLCSLSFFSVRERESFDSSRLYRTAQWQRCFAGRRGKVACGTGDAPAHFSAVSHQRFVKVVLKCAKLGSPGTSGVGSSHSVMRGLGKCAIEGNPRYSPGL